MMYLKKRSFSGKSQSTERAGIAPCYHPRKAKNFAFFRIVLHNKEIKTFRNKCTHTGTDVSRELL